jgi:hypothetical protein
MSGAVITFRMKLKVFNLCNFCFCYSLPKPGLASVPFPSVFAVEMIDSLSENLKMRFSVFHSVATNVCIFENIVH